MCNHEFIGTAEGVKCSLCGIEMTREEYKKFLTGGKVEKAEEPKEVAPKAPKAEQKKPAKKVSKK